MRNLLTRARRSEYESKGKRVSNETRSKTIAKFLVAAAEEFQKHGYEGSTIRAIAKRAQVNLGTLTHYWGSKQELFRGLFESRFQPLRQERLRRLRAVEAGLTTNNPPLAIDVLRAIVEPITFDHRTQGPGASARQESRASRTRFHALYARAAMDPSPQVIGTMVRIFDEPVQLFISLMRLACPKGERGGNGLASELHHLSANIGGNLPRERTAIFRCRGTCRRNSFRTMDSSFFDARA